MSPLEIVHKNIQICKACPNMCGTPVHGPAVETHIMLLGQAPGPHEAKYGYPFAYTAGKALFRWFEGATGINEDLFRKNIYISAVARCFPGKSATGKGDRQPDAAEIEACRRHISQEVKILRPELIVPVGKMAIHEILKEDFSKTTPLTEVVGKIIPVTFHGRKMDMAALPHPSGLSTWTHVEPGRTKLAEALKLIKEHPVWKKTFST